jgi:DNA-binding response OmpR family regulator
MNGWTSARGERSQQRVIVYYSYARSTVEDKVAGLGMGADDYLAKPFSLLELQARMQAVLRRNTGCRKTPLRFTILKSIFRTGP